MVELYQAYLYSWDDFWSRPVGSGAAWRRSPHQKPAGRDKKKKEEKEGKIEKEKRGERKERGENGKKGRGEQERKMY